MVDHKVSLTARQQQLLRHIARGETSKDFAEKHCLALKTVNAHRERLMKAIDCHNVAEVTKYAIIHGYITLGCSP